MRKSILMCLLVSLILVGTFTSAQDTKTVVWAFPADSTTFNTITQAESVDSFVQGMIFPSLNINNLETGLPGPYLATWEVSEDGLTYTFTIHEDAVWSDGVPITSTDVLFTLNAVFSEHVETFRTIDGVDSMNAIDDKHFEIVLANSTCGLFSQIGVFIMPAHKFADDYSDFATSEFNTHPDISGGPFVFSERSVDEYLRFEANDTFFLGRPEIDQLLLQVIVDEQVRIQSMQSGTTDYLGGLDSEQIAPFMDDPSFNVHYTEANALFVALFNHADPAQPMAGYDEEGNIVEQPPHPILGDQRVRQALIQGWDHEDGTFLMGEGSRRLVGPVAPILETAYNDELELYPYDPDAAAALLDEAGWVLNGDIREKDGEPLELEIAYLEAFTEVAAVMADYWSDLGVDVTLTTGEQGVMINETFVSQTFDIFVVSASWNEPTPDVLLNFLFNGHNDFGFNAGSFVDAEFDGLLAEVATADCSAEARKPMYDRLQEIMHEQAATDFISTIVGYAVTSSRISNVEITTWGTTPWQEWQVSD
jgi:peptide/nickel transport system substrate-binding protein